MGLSSDLIAQFVKITNDNSKTKTETTLYGTVVEKDGSVYVKIDGSDQYTPVSTTTDVKDGERVTVMIKNHQAVITGNISSPAARTEDVQNLGRKITEVETLVADKVSTKVLEAEQARITSLEAKNVTITNKLEAAEVNITKLAAEDVTINGKLTAVEGNIETLTTKKLDASVADITYATIKSLEATDTKVNNLEATYGDFKKLTTDNFEAVNGNIEKLATNKLDASVANITYATIKELNATKGAISSLESDVADIDTLIFGSASGTTIQTSFANAVIAQLGNAQIKSAMIDNVSASKITTGNISTNNVKILSDDGKMLISDETIQISDDSRVRVQIGKDAANDYSINVWDDSGNLMFSKGGITDSAIKEAIIRNDMVSESANISASKLDIDSLFEEINSSSKTIKSTKIYLDDKKQTLDVAFTSLTTGVGDLQNGLTSQGTQISAIQGQITSKIWKDDIDEAKGILSNQYSSLEQEVNNISATVGQHTSQISKKADGSTVTAVSNKVTELETDLSGFKSTVSNTYATKNEFENIAIGGRNLVRDSKLDKKTDMWSLDYVHQTISFENGYFQVSRTKDDAYTSRSFNTQQSIWNPSLLPDNISGETYILSADFKAIDGVALNSNSSIFWRVYYDKNDNFEEINLRVPNDLNSTEWRRCYITYTFGEHDWVSSQLSIALQNVDNGICVRNIMLEKATKPSNWTPAPEDMATTYDLKSVGDRVSSAETRIEQTEKAISLVATRSEVEKTLEGYYTITQTNSAINAKANEISSTVYSNYATKTALDEANKDILLLSGDPTNYAKLTESTAAQWGFTVEDDVDGDWYVMNEPRRDTPISNEYECNGGEKIKIDYEVISDVQAITTNGGSDIGYINVNVCLYSKKGTGGHFNWSGVSAGKTSNTGESIFGSGVITLPAEARKFQVHIQLAGWGNFSGSFKIRNVKVSRISALDDRVGTAESNISQLSNKITSTVNETDNLKTRMSTVEQTSSDLTVRLTDAEKDVDKAQSTANDAAKTATNYLNFSSSGLVVGNLTESTLKGNVLIDTDSVDIRQGSTVLASYQADKIKLGLSTKNNILIDTDSVDFYNGGTLLASFSADTVVLGQNSAASTISLCGGAGTISALISEAATSYPAYDAILIASQEINMNAQRYVADITNKHNTTSKYENNTEIYTLSYNDVAGSYGRLASSCEERSSGNRHHAGVSISTSYPSTPSAYMYAEFWDAGAGKWAQSNSLRVFMNYTSSSKPIKIQGTEFTGENKVLWSGVYYMSSSQTATLSESIDSQANGIVLVFSRYSASTAQNYHFNMHYVPKSQISTHGGCGHVFTMTTDGSFSVYASKYLYINNTNIVGNANNEASGTGTCGISYKNNGFVLRYVIGV